jgi:hypothetical protein
VKPIPIFLWVPTKKTPDYAGALVKFSYQKSNIMAGGTRVAAQKYTLALWSMTRHVFAGS